MDISAFITKWHLASGGERKSKDSLLNDLCDALGVPRPDVPTGDPELVRHFNGGLFEDPVALPLDEKGL